MIGGEDERYFERLEEEGVTLRPAQKRWWVKKAEMLGGDMKRSIRPLPTRRSSRLWRSTSCRTLGYAPRRRSPAAELPNPIRQMQNTASEYLSRASLQTIPYRYRGRRHDAAPGGEPHPQC